LAAVHWWTTSAKLFQNVCAHYQITWQCPNLRLVLELLAAFRYHYCFFVQGYPVVLPRLPSPRQSIEKLALAIAVTGMVAFGGVALGRSLAPEPVMPTVALAALPAEVQQTEQLIRKGGPFAYAKDGGVFGNRERLLPPSARGYYREYTVTTPGARDRGARRIVCGGSQPTKPDACYYTSDHYASFARILQ
jgi:ribonuclease T1